MILKYFIIIIKKKVSTQNGHDKQLQAAAAAVQQHQSIPNSQSIDLLALNFTPPSSTSKQQAQTTTPQKSDQEALLDIFGGPVPQIPQIPQQTHQHTHNTMNNNIDSLFSSTFDSLISSSTQQSTTSQPNATAATTTNSQLPPFTPITSIVDQHMQFLFKNSDVLFENQALRIQSKAEFKKNLGRVTLDVSNKSAVHAFQSFQVLATGDAVDTLRVFVKSADSNFIQAGATLQTIVNVECVNEFSHVPQVTVQFR
jgi:hypothetical protein